MPQKQLVLVQPQLAVLDGHEHTQIRALEWLLPHHRLTVVTNQGCALAEQLQETQLLQLLPGRQRNRRLPWNRSLPDPDAHFAWNAALKEALAKSRVAPSDLLLVPSAGPREIAAIVDFMENETTRCPPARLRILSEDVVSRLEGQLMERLCRLCTRDRVILYTETMELCLHLRQHHQLPVQDAFYLPCTILPGQVSGGLPHRADQVEVRVGVLGRQRAEKGSYRIPSILAHLRRMTASDQSRAKICLVYQAVRDKRLRRLVLEAKTRLGTRRNQDMRIEFLDSGMEGPEFRRMLLGMDVLLLPYDTRRYRYSGSGIIMDGVAAQKPMVHSKGMAMRGLLSHGNAEAAGTDRDFAEKLLQVATQLPRYKQGTSNALAHLESLLSETASSLNGDQARAAG